MAESDGVSGILGADTEPPVEGFVTRIRGEGVGSVKEREIGRDALWVLSEFKR
jgi:hypothetical protein